MQTALPADMASPGKLKALKLVQRPAHAHDRHLEPLGDIGQVLVFKGDTLQDRQKQQLRGRADLVGRSNRDRRRPLAQIEQGFRARKAAHPAQ